MEQQSGAAKAPTLGVVIPVYNTEQFVAQTIRSVCDQPCKDLIVVVVDDGSKDRSYEICKELAEQDGRIHVLHQENAGVSVARNTGIAYCIEKNASFIAFLDSDDVWCKDIYTNALHAELQSSDADLFQFGYYTGDVTLRRGRRHPADMTATDGTPKRFTGTFCSCIFRADIIARNDISFPQGIKCQEDPAFFYVFACFAKKMTVIDQEIFIYRSNPTSAVHRKYDTTDRFFNHVLPAWDWAQNKLQEALAKGSLTDPQAISGCESVKKAFISEYIQVALQNGMSVRSVRDVLHERNAHAYYAEDSKIWVDEVSKKRYFDFMTRPGLVWLRYRSFGLFIKFARLIKKIPLVCNVIYPERIVQLH